ncbi:MAG: hypothetical protein U0835_12910 [Isosphaeraceae bacterium]
MMNAFPRKSATALLSLVACASLFARASVPVSAQEAKAKMEQPPARSGFALTIYSSADPRSFDPRQFRDGAQGPIPGYGVVRESRQVPLENGLNTVRFSDVASGIDPTTVSFASETDPAGTSVVEQDYEFDLVGSDKLLQKYLGQPITVQPKGQAPFKATLLAAEPGSLVLSEGSNGQIRIVPRQPDPAEITLPALPSGLITRPTLVWKVAANKPGPHQVRVSYQTDGLTWRADYNLVLSGDESKSDLGAWVTILNQSGASYPGAKLKLVAGDVQRITPPPQPIFFKAARTMAAPAPMAEGFQEKAFFEYHMYTLGRPTSLADRSTKQIELFPARAGVPVVKNYVYYGVPKGFVPYFGDQPNPDRNLGAQSNKKVDIYLSLKNSEANGMGVPLPAGRVRVYKKDDADAALEFVGEDSIDHTPKNEEILVKLGSAFDVVGERKQTDFQADLGGHRIDESFEITLRNQKTEPVKVIVKETLFRWATWQITGSSDPFEKQDARTIHIPVVLPAGAEKTVTYTVRYTW